MNTIKIDIPEEILISLKETPETIADELRMLAAVKLFELGKLSSGRAAQLAGVSRVKFLTTLGEYQVSPFSLTPEELAQDAQIDGKQRRLQALQKLVELRHEIAQTDDLSSRDLVAEVREEQLHQIDPFT